VQERITKSETESAIMPKVDPFKDPIRGTLIIREDEGPTRGASHRGGGRQSKLFGFYDPEHGITVRASIATYTPERLNPRHKHVDEVVRYYYRGAESYGKDVLQEGDCVYIPEGVYYGPTKTADGYQENRRIVFHFPGPSGLKTPVVPEILKAQKDMPEKGIGRFEKGIFVWADGHKQDSFEAIHEYITGGKVQYPEARYHDYVIMRQNKFPWEPLDGVAGVNVRHLGYFNERGPNIKIVKMDPNSETAPGKVPFLQVRYVLEGAILYEGESYDSVSCMLIPANAAYSTTATSTGATLLVIQLGAQGGKAPDFCLI
jgi:hypothetical protein